MQMPALGCKSRHDGIMTAAVFALFGGLLIVTAITIIPDIQYIPGIILASGIALLLFVPVIIIATFIKNRSG